MMVFPKLLHIKTGSKEDNRIKLICFGIQQTVNVRLFLEGQACKGLAIIARNLGCAKLNSKK